MDKLEEELKRNFAAHELKYDHTSLGDVGRLIMYKGRIFRISSKSIKKKTR